jgi:hypothetical protein
MLDKENDAVILDDAVKAAGITEVRRQEALLKTGALQNAILTSANFSIIATDEKASFNYSMSAPSACWAIWPPKS